MKRGNAVLLSSVLLASLLCSCGSAASSAPAGGASSAVSSSSSGSSAAPDAAPTAAPTQTPAPAGQPISQLFSKATGVSREWQDGKYIINGLDASGNKICAIADSDGNAVPVDGYTALYPLADGHLLATTDEDASGKCDYAGNSYGDGAYPIRSLGIAGVILDENYNVIYQPDDSLGFERLFPINSHILLSIRAKTGFDGRTVTMSALDQNGNFLYDCGSDEFNLADFLHFDDEGVTWQLPASSTTYSYNITFGRNDNLGENRLIKISASGVGQRVVPGINDKGFTYCVSFGEESCTTKYIPNDKSVRKTYSKLYAPYNSTCFISGGFVQDLDANTETVMPWETFPENLTDFSVITDIQSALLPRDLYAYSNFGLIGTDDNGTGYFLRTSYVANQTTNTIESTTYTFFAEDGHEIAIPQNYLDAYDSKCLLVGNNFLLALSGSDGKDYAALVSPTDGSATEPFLVADSIFCAALQDSLLAIGYRDSICLYNTENGQKQGEISLSPDSGSVNSLFFRGSTLVAACEDENDDVFYHIYSLTDNSTIL